MFDSHPQIVQIYPQHGLNAAYLHVLPDIADLESVEDVVNAALRCFARVDGHSESWTSLTEERAGVFSEVLAHHLFLQRTSRTLTRRSVFLAIHAAFAFAMDCLPKTDCPLVVWQSHANDFQLRRQIRKDFPEARFIVMARYPPRARDSALLAFSEAMPSAFPEAKGSFWHMDQFGVSLITLIHMAEMGRTMSDDEDIIAVRFEDLHMHTRQTMQWLAQWLGIEWDESLLQSTLRGVGWGKHSMYPAYGVRFNVGTRTLSYEDFYTRGQSRIDLIKYGAYQREFADAWAYDTSPTSPAITFLAMNVLCYWPTELQWRTLRTLMRHRGGRSRIEIFREFLKKHAELAKEFRSEYRRQRRKSGQYRVIGKAPVSDRRWPRPK